MKEEITFTAKQVGERVKERRLELNLTMPELGKRIGVNKSTIQRYEADGVDPKRTMIINGLAEALLTTPEWLTGLSEEKEYDAKTLCQRDIESHIAIPSVFTRLGYFSLYRFANSCSFSFCS